MSNESVYDDDDELVSLREGARRIGVQNLNDFFRKYGSRPPYDPRSGDGPRLWRLGDLRSWYGANVAKPRPRP